MRSPLLSLGLLAGLMASPMPGARRREGSKRKSTKAERHKRVRRQLQKAGRRAARKGKR